MLAPMDGELRKGSEFRGLRVHGVLAHGGMGTAYLVSHGVLKCPLILKTFTPPKGTEIFQEAQLAARVASPHVVGVLDAGIEGGTPFLVQRYVDGLDLQEVVDFHTDVPLATSAVVRMVSDVARGLGVIHRAGVVHRDIKPANLFFCGDGSALLGDFGIARDKVRVAGSSEPPAGTPLFIAPEIWNGGQATPRSDLYALGATAHLLATGRKLYERANPAQLFLAHVTEPYVAPLTDDPARAFLFTTVKRLLAKEPDERPPHAEAVVRMLERIEQPLEPFAQRGENHARVAGINVELRHGDLAAASADVLVNAAYSHLTMDLGVAASLRAAGGQIVEDEAMAHAPRGMGDVVWTSAGKLRAKHVAHAIAAIDDAICIQRATLRTLLGARQRQAATIAFPALGTGVGQVPHALGAKLMFEAIRTFGSMGRGSIEQVQLWLYDPESFGVWREVLAEM